MKIFSLHSHSRPPVSMAGMKSSYIFGFDSHIWPVDMSTELDSFLLLFQLVLWNSHMALSVREGAGAPLVCDMGDWTNSLCSLLVPSGCGWAGLLMQNFPLTMFGSPNCMTIWVQQNLPSNEKFHRLGYLVPPGHIFCFCQWLEIGRNCFSKNI